MKTNSKYKRTEKIKSLDELSKQDFIKLRNKVYHRGWYESWQYRQVKNLVDRGLIYKVELKEKQ